MRIVLALACAIGLGTVTAAQADTGTRYIVQLTEPPLASYRGGINGLEATNPAARNERKLNVSSAASRAYLSHLASRQSALLSSIGGALGRPVQPVFTYRYAYNGFAIVATESEASRIASIPGVKRVQKDYVRQPVTDVGPAWIGAPSIWDGSQTGGRPATRGEGVVVGVIDTGINHDHPSFADVGGDGYNHTNPRGRFYGACDPVLGTPFCNDKLIGVWDFTGTTPLDDNQHGSHTASTTAGNVLNATVNAPTISITRRISGVAPHANLITYKACIAVGCLGASLTAAIDQATADGVDVINYSIGGGPTDPWGDSDSEGFLGARDAGVFVSASAGNDGPRPETVGSPANAPWLLSVGASTHNRSFVNAVTGMSGGSTAPPSTLNGKSFTSGYGPAPIVSAAAYGDELCGAPFAPGTFSGEIVVCKRGVNPRVEKGRNVKLGGAGGMVLINSAADGESEVADGHELPAVHLAYTEGVTLMNWLSSGSGHTGTIAGTTADETASNGDIMAGFSSRGPNKPVPGVIKPDVTAPGVDVLAAIHTTNPASPPEYGVLSGTSMSSPHAAGSAALIRAVHPEWTPAEVQSAMTSTGKTSGVRKDDGVKAADAFDMGGGRVDLTQAARAGLVLDEQTPDYVAADPAEGGNPTTLNLATIGHHDCDGECSWKRTVKNALGAAATWSVRTSGPRGMRLTVSPNRFSLAPGATQELTITADVRQLPVGKWVFAQVRLSASGAAEQHFPLAVFTGAAQPVDITTSSTSGSHVASVTSQVEIRELQTSVFGLQEGTVTQQLVEQDPTPTEGPYDVSAGTFFVNVNVPAGSKFLATEIVDSLWRIDLDLFVGRDTDGDGAPDENEELCRSASEVWQESCRLSAPAGGNYWVLVQNWLSVGADEVKLVTSVIPGTSAGNLTVSGPASVPANTPFDVTLTWNEPSLASGDTWFALVELGSDRRHPNNAKSLLVKLTRN